MREHAKGETIPAIGLTRQVIGRKADGSGFAMELTITDLRPMEQRMLVAVARDVRERLREEADLREADDHDELTGLITRNAFEREATRHIRHSERYGDGGSIIVLGAEGLTTVAKGHSPSTVNEILKEMGDLLRDRLRTTDFLARVGDESFAALIHNTASARAAEVARELIELISLHTFVTSAGPLNITISAGVAELGSRPITGVELLAEAEGAMESAMDLGAGSVVDLTADADAAEGAEADRMWAERGMFVLACQPTIEIASGRIVQYELLLRVRGDNGELAPPGVFLATAKRFGLIGSVDRWVAQEAVRQIAAHAEAGSHLVLEVNLSDRSLGDAGFAAHVKRELEATGVDPSRLIFEAGEADLRDDLDKAAALATELTAMGCRFGLDDFGAGVGSLEQLKALPLNFLKIDGRVTAGMAASPADRSIVTAVVALCGQLGIATIAEGVEDERTLAAAGELGITYAQGHYIGHPHPVADLRPGG